MKFKLGLVLIMTLFVAFNTSVFAGTVAPYTPDKIFYVDKAASGSGTGLTWTNAFTTIQAAIGAAAAATPAVTANWGHIILVKPGTYPENLTISNDADLVGLKIMSTDLSSSVTVQAVTPASPTLTYNGLGSVTIKGLKFVAVATQNAVLLSIPGAGGVEGANLQCISCYFDIGALAIHAVNIGAAIAITNTRDMFVNCTFDLDAATTAQAAVNVNSVAKLTNLTMTGCTVLGKAANVPALNALALNVTATSIFDVIILQGNTFNYAKVLVQFDNGAAGDQNNLDILGNHFYMTDGVQVLASAAAEANTQYDGEINVIGNHFTLNDVTSATPRDDAYALHIGAGKVQILPADVIFQYNNITVKQPDASLTLGGHIAVTNAGGAATIFAANEIAAAKIAGNWWGVATGPVAIAAGLVASQDAEFTAAVVANCWGNTGNPYVVPVIDPSSGIQMYDIDFDGHLDKAAINFTKSSGSVEPMLSPGSLPTVASGAILMGSSYVVTNISLDISNYRIVNVYFQEKTDWDTGALPQVVYNSALNATNFGGLSAGSSEKIASWQEVGAVEIDEAQPVFVKAETQDVGAGTGTPAPAANNGLLDGIKLTFSEPVQTIKAKAGSVLGAEATEPDSNLVVLTGNISFNQGSPNGGKATANTYTIPVGETVINTGLIPTIKYDASLGGIDDPITDYGKNALGDINLNNLYLPGALLTITITAEDAAAMVVNSVQTADSGTPDGKIDKILVTFSEPVTVNDLNADGVLGNVSFVSTVPAFSSASNVNGVYTHTAAVPGGSVITFTITPVADAKYVFDTESVPTFTYTPASTTTGTDNIVDASGIQLAAYGGTSGLPKATTDGAAPVIVRIETGDNYYDEAYAGASDFEGTGPNGRLDTVRLIFSEAVSSSGINAATTAALLKTAVDDAIGQFVFTHSLSSAVMVNITNAMLYADGGPVWTNTTLGDGNTVLVIHVKEQSHGATAMVNGGDTGAKPGTVYTKASAAKAIVDFAASPNELVSVTTIANTVPKDKAAPFIVDGLYKHDGVTLKDSTTTGESSGWKNLSFANIYTVDSAPTTGSEQFGNGYIDVIEMKASENLELDVGGSKIAVGTADPLANLIGAFTPAEQTGYSDLQTASIKLKAGAAVSDIIVVTMTNAALSSTWDTGTRPSVAFTAANMGKAVTKYYIHDDADKVTGAGDLYNPAGLAEDETTVDLTASGDNLLAAIASKVAYDGAKPVQVLALGGVGSSTLNVTFSERVYSSVYRASFVPTTTPSYSGITGTALFGFENTGGVGASGISAVMVTESATADGRYSIVTVTANTAFLAGDHGDKIWIMGSTLVYDAASYLPDGTYFNVPAASKGNGAIGALAGGNIRFGITIDTVMPYITILASLDTDGNGIVDYLKFTFKENIINRTVPNYVVDGMTADVKSQIRLTVTVDGVASVYAGTLKWNMITSTTAALAAGEPLFSDNLVDNNILYLALDEASIPAGYPALSLGNTAYRPVVSFLVAPVMADLSGNRLTTNPAVDVSPAPAATAYFDLTKPVLDQAPPVIMSARTVSTTKMELILSEKVPGKDVDKTDFDWWVGNAGSGQDANIARIDTTTVAKLTFEVSQANSWNEDMGEGLLQWKAGASLADMALNNLAIPTYANVNAVLPVTTDIDVQATYYMAGATATAAPVANPLLNAVQYVNVVNAIVPTPAEPVGAPADLVLTDVPNDNGHWVLANFTVSADHLTRAKSYQFYTRATLEEAWALTSWVPAGVVDANNKMLAYVPVPVNGTLLWAVVASSGDALSGNAAAKAGDIAVAALVENGAAKAAEGDVLSALSDEVSGGAIDNLAPSALEVYAANDNAGAGAGIRVSWTAPADHAQVGQYGIPGVYVLPIYGVDQYEVYRRTSATADLLLIGSAGALATSYVDQVTDGITVYEYMIKYMDGNPDHTQQTSSVWAMANANHNASDFNSDGIVNFDDFDMFVGAYGKTADAAGWVALYDLAPSGEINFDDFDSFVGDYGFGAKGVAKVAVERPESNVAFALNAEIDAASSMYYVTLNMSDITSIHGFEVSLNYDTDALELVEESVVGPVGLIIPSYENGVVSIADMFNGEEFSGTLTIGFKSIGTSRGVVVELKHALVADNALGINKVTDLTNASLRALPTVYALSKNFPNPFNPTTTIEYQIPASGNVDMVIYNMTGQKVRTLINEVKSAGFYKVTWDGKNNMGETVASGLYFYKLVSGNFNKIEKMTLVK